MAEFWGKYRGTVMDNDDPLKIGRIQAVVPVVSEETLNWAMPCAPYAGVKVGFYTVPPVGAKVWIEFEGGDPNYPIWSGAFWEQGSDMPPDATGPALKVFQTDKMVLILDDENQRMIAKVPTDSGLMSIVLDKDGITIKAAEVKITVTPDKIELLKTPASVVVAEAITLKKAAASAEISDSITLKNGAASVEVQQAGIDLKNGASSINMSPAAVNVNNGALEVM